MEHLALLLLLLLFSLHRHFDEDHSQSVLLEMLASIHAFKREGGLVVYILFTSPAASLIFHCRSIPVCTHLKLNGPTTTFLM